MEHSARAGCPPPTPPVLLTTKSLERIRFDWPTNPDAHNLRIVRGMRAKSAEQKDLRKHSKHSRAAGGSTYAGSRPYRAHALSSPPPPGRFCSDSEICIHAILGLKPEDHLAVELFSLARATCSTSTEELVRAKESYAYTSASYVVDAALVLLSYSTIRPRGQGYVLAVHNASPQHTKESVTVETLIQLVSTQH